MQNPVFIYTQSYVLYIFFSVGIGFGIVYRPLRAHLIYLGVVVSLKQMHCHNASEMSGNMLPEQAKQCSVS